MILTSITSYSTHKYFVWANKWCSVILWYLETCILHSWPQIVTLWATIAIHLRTKIAENGWKQVFDDIHFRNHLFCTQICSLSQWVVFNYPLVSPKVLTTLRTLHSYPIAHHSHSFVNKNGRKRSNRFLMSLTSQTSYSTHKFVLWFNGWCSNILWYHPRWLLYSWPHRVTLWATLATHLWTKIVENG
jgi:hypothetical protein